MAEFVEVIKQRNRMCSDIRVCAECELGKKCDEHFVMCAEYMKKYPEEAEKIIMAWAKEHPIMSNVDKLYQIIKESFGGEIAEAFKAIIEMKPCYTMECNHEVDCEKCENRNFWRQEWKEPKEDN